MSITALFTFPSPIRSLRIASLLLILCCSLGLAQAAENSNKALNNTLDKNLTAEIIESKIKLVNEKQGLEEANKNKIVTIYQAAKENLDDLTQARQKTSYYQDALSSAPLKIKTLQAELERSQNSTNDKPLENFQAIPTDELEQRYIIEKSKLSDLDGAINKTNSEVLLQNSRPQLIHTEATAAKQALDAAQQKLESFLQHGNNSKLEAEAQQLFLQTEIDARTAELKMYDLESISNNIRTQLLKLNLQQTDLKRAALEPVITAIEEQLAFRRQQAADKVNEELSQAEKDVADKPQVIQSITRENIQFSRELQSITQKLERLNSQKNVITAQTSAISENEKSAEKRINLANLSPALGHALREQRRNIHFSDEFLLQSQALENDTAIASLNQFKLEDKVKLLGDIDAEMTRLLNAQLDPNTPGPARARIKAELRILLNSQKEVLLKLSDLYTHYLRALNDLSFSRQELLTQANNYAAYLDKRLLWVPSSLPIDFDFPKQIYHALRDFLAPQHWLTIVVELFAGISKHPFLSFMALGNLLILRHFKNRVAHLILENNSKVLKPATDQFKYTTMNIILTMVLVAPMGLTLHYLGWFLSGDMQLSSFSKAFGLALRSISIPLFFIQFFHTLFSIDGIARKHFHWRKKPLAIIRTQLQLFKYLTLPALGIMVFSNQYDNPALAETLGRSALIISLVLLDYVLLNLANPKNEILPKHIYDNSQTWLSKLRWIWFPGLIGTPLVILFFAAFGYYQSALELNDKFIKSLVLIVIAIMLHELILRWLFLVNRQLAQENARINQILQEEAHEANINERLFDISTINAQTIQILNVAILLGLTLGAWMVWKDILPAFSILDQVELWQYEAMVDQQEVLKPITLNNLIFALLYLVIAIITVRNLAGLMELLIFRRLSIEAGSRYAVIQLSKYLIMTLALIRTAAELGGSWSQVQWLAAALGVGLGFGLQEIFANMVSGIILLFERPIRVGDTVTVGDTTGIVNRIQIRATTLIDNDQKELIVPNKTFITNQLINWTLTDPITRLVIPVGIAYGSNIELAHQIMLDTIREIPQILKVPEPSVLLVGFGDSALNFSIRIFVGKLIDRTQVTHDLHFKLEQAFRQHHIVIPYPHMDVSIHTDAIVPPLSIQKKHKA